MEKHINVTGPVFGIISTTAEILDSPNGPDYKIFRVKQGEPWTPGKHKTIFVHSRWSSFDTGEMEGRYRVCRRLEAPPEFVAVFEGTTLPEPKEKPVADNDYPTPRVFRCENAILDALAAGRASIRELKRRTHATRYGQDWDTALGNLQREGEIRLHTEQWASGKERVFVELAPNADLVAPLNDDKNGGSESDENIDS